MTTGTLQEVLNRIPWSSFRGRSSFATPSSGRPRLRRSSSTFGGEKVDPEAGSLGGATTRAVAPILEADSGRYQGACSTNPCCIPRPLTANSTATHSEASAIERG